MGVTVQTDRSKFMHGAAAVHRQLKVRQLLLPNISQLLFLCLALHASCSCVLCVMMFVEEVQADGERAVQGGLAASISGQHDG